MSNSTKNQPESRWKDILIAILIGLFLLLGWAFYKAYQRIQLQNKMMRRLESENDQLRKAYLDLLEKHLILEDKAGPDILEELERLKAQACNLSRDAHLELGSVIDLVNQGMHVKAVKDLTKIIENMLWEKAQREKAFTKKPILAQLLEHAKNCNWINANEKAYSELLRDIRNKESHELNVQEEPHRIGLAIFSGIQIIYSLNQQLA